MTPEQREQFLIDANEATPDPRRTMDEGRQHYKAKLSVQQGRLRFFQGMAELFGTAELLGRLTGMVEDLQAKVARGATVVEASNVAELPPEEFLEKLASGPKSPPLSPSAATIVGEEREARTRRLTGGS